MDVQCTNLPNMVSAEMVPVAPNIICTSETEVHKGGVSKGGFSNFCVSLVQL